MGVRARRALLTGSALVLVLAACRAPGALRWFRRAADPVHARSQANIAAMARAQYRIALLYATGRGVARNDAEAVRWLTLAAGNGLAEAQGDLGFMYLNGRGVARDDAEAVRWIRPAADQGYGPAQRYLAMLYRDGRAVAPDPEEALRWYRLAADQGEPLAQYDLGAMYGDGSGGRQDDASAYVWLSLAASRLSGDERERAARLRDEIGRRMSDGQRAEAARRARDWKPVFER